MEIPRLGVEVELQLLAYTTATAIQDLSQVCKLHHSSQQREILNLMSKGLNLHLHRCQSDSFPLSHAGNSKAVIIILLES